MTNFALGLPAVVACVILFGTFTLPTKRCETGDGFFFQWCMCSGIFFVGVVTHTIQCSVKDGECPAFIPLASLGGAIWCTSNLLLVPIVDTIGVGLCMMLWGMLEMMAGWTTARFGLFGLEKEVVKDPSLNYLGVALAALSLGVLIAVKPNTVEKESDTVKDPEDDSDLGLGPGFASSVGEQRPLLNSSPLPGKAAAPAKWTDRLAPWQRHTFGVLACVVAGLLSGSNFTPPQHVVDATKRWIAHGRVGPAPYPRASLWLLDYLFAHFTGIWLASTCYFLLYLVVMGTKRRQVMPEILLPSFAAGLVWGVAMVCWFNANAYLSIVISFPLVTLGPGLVNLFYGCVFFQEISGRRNFFLIALSVGIYLAASVCIVLSKI